MHQHPTIRRVIYDLTLETQVTLKVSPNSVEEGFYRQKFPSMEIVVKHQLMAVGMKWEYFTFQVHQQCAP